MPWGKDDGSPQSPWGKPSGGGNNQPNNGNNRGGGKGPQGPQPPDIDELLRKGQDRMRQILNGPGGGDNKRNLLMLAGVAALVWVASGVYLVRADEQGVVMRFGQFHRTTPPGIGYHLPYPVEAVRTPKVTSVNRVEIGFRSGYSRGSGSENSIPEESLMLTGDENIVDINFEVQWKVDKAEDFLFNVRNPEDTVKAVAESAMREVIGKSEFATVLAAGREQVELSTRKLIQDTLHQYQSGIEVVSVNLRDVNPPAQVIDAFRDVQSARADKETARNQAEAYRNDITPRARGEAEKLVLDSEAYKQEVIAQARGEASRFAAIYSQYKDAKEATKKRMYLETMEQILPGMNKVVVDKGGNGVLPYLPLSELKPAGGKIEEKR